MEDLKEIVKRFDRIETKLDAMSDAMIALARNEEKTFALQQNLAQHGERLNKLSVKIDDIEKMSLNNAVASKIVWAVLIGVIGSITSMLMGIL